MPRKMKKARKRQLVQKQYFSADSRADEKQTVEHANQDELQQQQQQNTYSQPQNFIIRTDNKALEWCGDPYQRSALNKRNADYLANELRADMWFHVLQDNVRLPAHRMIVGTASPVLETIAYGTGAIVGSIGDVPVHDCSADDFYEVLRFVYTGSATLNAQNCADVLLLAHYYNLQSLEDDCTAMLLSTLSVQNVCATFAKIHQLDNASTKECLRFIRSNNAELFGDEQNLFDLPIDALRQVIVEGALRLDSYVDLFAELLKWGRTQCRQEDSDEAVRQPPTGMQLRVAVIGRLAFVNFGSMTPDHFARCVQMVEKQFFTDSEVSSIFQKIARKTARLGLNNPPGPTLNCVQRSRKLHFEDTTEIESRLTVATIINEFRLKVKCDHKCLLHGFDGVSTAAPFTVEWSDSPFVAKMTPIGVQMYDRRALLNEPLLIETTWVYLKFKYAEQIEANYAIVNSSQWSHGPKFTVESTNSRYPVFITILMFLITEVED